MKKFDEELKTLRQRLLEMGQLCQAMVAAAVKALNDPRSDGFEEVQRMEQQLDQMQLDIDREAIRMMTVYGPVAADLRFLLMVSRIDNELERIGDQAVNIFEDLRLMALKTAAVPPAEIHKMAHVVEGMLNDALKSFSDQDHRLAHQTVASDDLVDAMNDQIISELLSHQVVRQALDDPSVIASSLAVILLARSLERIADQATNICEEVVYMVRGTDIRHTEPSPASEG